MGVKMREPSVRKNYIYNTFYQMLNLFIPFITAPYTARVFGAEGIGIQSYTGSVLSYFTLFAALGTVSYGQREIARHRNDKSTYSVLFWEIELLSVLTTGVCLCLWIVVIICSRQYRFYFMVMSFSLLAVAFDISWFFGGLEKFKFIVIRNTLIRVAGLGILFLLVREKNDLLLYIGLIGATGLAGNLSMWSYLPRYLSKVNFHCLHICRHFRQTMAYFIPMAATSVYTVLDKTMIGMFTVGTQENGYYEQATKIVKMAQTIILSLNTVMSARMSYLFAENKLEEIRLKLIQSFEFILFLSIPVTVGLIGIAPGFISWFLGIGYKEVVPLMRWFSITIIVIGISNCLGMQYLTPSGQRSRSSKAIITGAIVNLLCNLCLIPIWGAKGAVIGSVIAESVIALSYIYMSREYVCAKTLISLSYKRVFASIIMLWVILILDGSYMMPAAITILQVTAGAITYIVVLALTKDSFLYDIFGKIKQGLYEKNRNGNGGKK